MTRTLVLFAAVALAVVPAVAAETAQIHLKVTLAADAGSNVPVGVAIDIPAALAGPKPEALSATVAPAGGKAVVGQVVLEGKQAKLYWVLPEAKAGTTQWTATLSTAPYKGTDVFAFQDTPGKYMDLLFDGRKVDRYMYERDTSTPETTFDTTKVYHHVFDEAGKEFITKGPGGLYPHHRGIFMGWRATKHGGKSYDTWHCRKGEALLQKEVLSQSVGPVLGRSVLKVQWVGGKTVLLEETRCITVYRQPKPTVLLMDFHSTLQAVNGAVELGGDPEHAGMQYRPANEVSTNKGDKATVYEFPADGIKTKGQKLNNNKDLPWAAMSYALGDKWYNVQHVNHPSNPKGTRYSAYRPYGRFGAFPVAKIADGGSLVLQYRIDVRAGKMPPREELATRANAFHQAPKVEVVK